MAEENNNSTVILSATPKPGAAVHQNALPVGTLIGEFEIIDLVGEGGFGIVYLAQDHSLHRKVALKEYMPASLASRAPDSSVTVRSERHRETFGIGLRSFVNEARILAQYDHAALVKVYRFWEANGTAYMVMPFFSGITLQDELKKRTDAPEEAWIRKILSPVMEALAIIHADNCFHRDIAPDNIMLIGDERPVLLDFGAARRVISDMTQALTVILKPGYAPIEQYAEMPGMKQGPWTDVYALAAVVYFMILNRKPPPSVGRMMQDTYEPLATCELAGRYSPQFLQGIDKCLSVKAEDRPQNIAEMREAIGFTSSMPATPASPPAQAPQNKAKEATKPAPKTVTKPPVAPTAAVRTQLPKMREVEEDEQEPQRSKLPLLLGIGAVIAAAAGGGYWYVNQQQATTIQAAKPAAPPAVAKPSTPAPLRFANLSAAVDGAIAASDARLAPSVDLPTSITVGNDLKLSVTSKADGYLYAFVWDQVEDKIYRVFPNDKDGNTDGANLVKANTAFAIPHSKADAWKFSAKEPLGAWRVLTVVSEKPRDLSKASLTKDGDFFVTTRATLDPLLSSAGLTSLIGSVACAASEANCQDHFALVASNVNKIAPAPVAVPAAPATKASAAKPAAPPASPGKKTPDSEREYMKRLNKDLDNLLGN